ncbi:MAG TPA: ATP-binding protein [Stellaceae bacterium]|nr:ATP-binding protein [Stellaceae bacterium]
MRGHVVRRSALLVLAVMLPAVAVFGFLYAAGRLDPDWALAAGTATAAVTALIVGPAALALAVSRDAIEALSTDPAIDARTLASRSPKHLTPDAAGLRSALGRAWRAAAQRGDEALGRLAAAEAVIAGIPDPLLLLDAQRRIVRANAASVDLLGSVPAGYDLATSLRNPAVLSAADAVLHGEAERVVEFSIAVPVERWLSARFARIDGPPLDGAVAVLTLHDITALKRAEQMRADFIANAGHELKTPLATLIGFIETLRGPARDDPAARERFLGIMNEQAERMARLVNDLLSLSRIELNEHIAPTDRVALVPLVEHIADTLELRAADRGMQLVPSLPADLPEVLGDADELAQVFQNLLDNAIKYGRPDSEIRVVAELAGGERPNAPRLVRVAVIDRGDGIPSEHLPRLTERFYRVDTARSRELGGTGLGLAVVKHILNRHRGRLEIDSRLGVGSTFAVYLRCAPPAIADSGTTSRGRQPAV